MPELLDRNYMHALTLVRPTNETHNADTVYTNDIPSQTSIYLLTEMICARGSDNGAGKRSGELQ